MIEFAIYDGAKWFYRSEDAQVDSMDDTGFKIFTDAVTASGLCGRLVWDYEPPRWWQELPEDDERRFTDDLSEFAQWDYPEDVTDISGIECTYQKDLYDDVQALIQDGQITETIGNAQENKA